MAFVYRSAALTLALALVACGRIGFDAAGVTDGDGGTAISGDGGGGVDARAQATDPLPVSGPGASIYLGNIVPCYRHAWSGTRWGIAWVDTRDGSSGEIYFALTDGDGTKIGGDVRVTDDPASDECPSVVWNGSSFFVAFADDRNGTYDIHGQGVGEDGGLIGAAIPIVTGNGDQRQPTIRWNGSGYDLVWRDSRGTNVDVRYAALSAAGTIVGTPLTLSGAGTSSMGLPNLAVTPAGAAAVWHDDSTGAATVQYALVTAGVIAATADLGAAVFQPGGLAGVPPGLASAGGELAVTFVVPGTPEQLSFLRLDPATGSATSPPTSISAGRIHAMLCAGDNAFGLTVASGRFVPLALDGTPTDNVLSLGGGTATLAYDGSRFAALVTLMGVLSLVFITP